MNDLPYRKGVNAIVVDKNNNFLLVQKQNYDSHQWDFPGGGVEQNEKLETAMLRELEEEVGTNKFEIVEKSPHLLKYEWPKEAQEHAHNKHGKWWRGQEKHQFIVKFTGKKSDIQIQENEIRQIKWVPYNKLKDHLVFENQWKDAKRAIKDSDLIKVESK